MEGDVLEVSAGQDRIDWKIIQRARKIRHNAEGSIVKSGDGAVQFCQDICAPSCTMNHNHGTQVAGLSLLVKFLLNARVADKDKLLRPVTLAHYLLTKPEQGYTPFVVCFTN